MHKTGIRNVHKLTCYKIERNRTIPMRRKPHKTMHFMMRCKSETTAKDFFNAISLLLSSTSRFRIH